MSLFGKNIRKIRTFKKLSQSAFADIFGLTRASVGAYEEGRAEPRTDTVIEIAKHFSISTDKLLTKELTVNEIARFENVAEKIKNISVLHVNQVKFVPVGMYETYSKNSGDANFEANLPLVSMPVAISDVKIAFEFSGNELLRSDFGLKKGDILYCKKINADDLRSEKLAVAVAAGQIFIRFFEFKNNKITGRVFDPRAEKSEFLQDEIKQIWEVAAVYSTSIPHPDSISAKIDNLEKILNDKCL